MKKIILSLALVASTGMIALAQNPATQPPPRDAQSIDRPAPTPAAAPAVDKNAPEIVFESETIDYGTIPHFADGKREFKFKNKGKSPLIITNCQGSCGCTVPTWPKEAIMPGKSAVINVNYATDRVGTFEKSVTVTSNANTPTKVLHIKGTVLAEPATKPDANSPAVTPPAKDEHAGHNH